MARSGNPRAIKIHHSYTYDEAARASGFHKNSIARWVKSGQLPALTETRPYLILGRDLRAFLEKRRTGKRRKLAMGEMLCLRCKASRIPAAGTVEVAGSAPGAANLIALCPTCTSIMHRRVSQARLADFIKAAATASSSGERH